MKTLYGIVALTLAVSLVAVAAEPKAMAELDKALKEVAAPKPPAANALQLVEQTVIESVKDPERRNAVEGRLLATLAAAKTFEAKSFLCRQLRTIGTARSIPQLEAMLTDPQLSHMARYALARLEDPAAVAALYRALGKTSGQCQVGIIYSLAARRCRKAVGDLVKLMGSPAAAVAAAALRAVGRIGGDEGRRPPAFLSRLRLRLPLDTVDDLHRLVRIDAECSRLGHKQAFLMRVDPPSSQMGPDHPLEFADAFFGAERLKHGARRLGLWFGCDRCRWARSLCGSVDPSDRGLGRGWLRRGLLRCLNNSWGRNAKCPRQRLIVWLPAPGVDEVHTGAGHGVHHILHRIALLAIRMHGILVQTSQSGSGGVLDGFHVQAELRDAQERVVVRRTGTGRYLQQESVEVRGHCIISRRTTYSRCCPPGTRAGTRSGGTSPNRQQRLPDRVCVLQKSITPAQQRRAEVPSSPCGSQPCGHVAARPFGLSRRNRDTNGHPVHIRNWA